MPLYLLKTAPQTERTAVANPPPQSLPPGGCTKRVVKVSKSPATWPSGRNIGDRLVLALGQEGALDPTANCAIPSPHFWLLALPSRPSHCVSSDAFARHPKETGAHANHLQTAARHLKSPDSALALPLSSRACSGQRALQKPGCVDDAIG